MRTVSAFMVLGLLLAGAAPLAAAEYPGEKTRLLRLADKFEDRAFDVLDEALKEHRYPNRQQEAGIEAFRELAWVSAYFHDQVRVDPLGYGARDDFQVLAEAFTRASGWMSRTRFDRDVLNDFRKLERAFFNLDSYVGAQWGYGRVGRQRMEDGRYRQTVRTRVIPRVKRHPRNRRPSRGVHVDVGLRFPNGRVRVVWH